MCSFERGSCWGGNLIYVGKKKEKKDMHGVVYYNIAAINLTQGISMLGDITYVLTTLFFLGGHNVIIFPSRRVAAQTLTRGTPKKKGLGKTHQHEESEVRVSISFFCRARLYVVAGTLVLRDSLKGGGLDSVISCR